jgi:hypothetical protein
MLIDREHYLDLLQKNEVLIEENMMIKREN